MQKKLAMLVQFAIINTVKQQNKTEHNMQNFNITVTCTANNKVVSTKTKIATRCNSFEDGQQVAEKLFVEPLASMHLDTGAEDYYEWDNEDDTFATCTIHVNEDIYYTLTVQ
jgi:hypothetical protein